MEDALASRFDFTRSPSPTPPLPLRNPNHRYPRYLAQPRRPNTSAKLHPKPLFSSKSETVELPSPPLELELHFDIDAARKLPDYPLRPASTLSSVSYSHSYAQSSAPSSPATSFRSLASHASSATSLSSPASDVPSAFSSLSSDSHLYPPLDTGNHEPQSVPSPPRRLLRRKTSPKKETLRSLRAKESDVCLQRAYEQQLDAYLGGTLFPRARWREDSVMGCVLEEE